MKTYQTEEQLVAAKRAIDDTIEVTVHHLWISGADIWVKVPAQHREGVVKAVVAKLAGMIRKPLDDGNRATIQGTLSSIFIVQNFDAIVDGLLAKLSAQNN